MLGPFVRCCHWPWLAYQEGGIVLLRAHCLWHPPKEDALCQCSSNITVAVAGWCVVLITWVCARKIFATWLEGRAITFMVCMAFSYVTLASCEVTLRRSHLQMSTHVCSFEGMVTSGYTREAAKAAVCSWHLKKDEALHCPRERHQIHLICMHLAMLLLPISEWSVAKLPGFNGFGRVELPCLCSLQASIIFPNLEGPCLGHNVIG